MNNQHLTAVLADQADASREITAIIRSVLEMEDITLNDDFFEAGGDSLAAVRVMTRVRRRYNVQISLSSLFKYPTAKTLAEHVISLLQGSRDERPQGQEV